MLNNKKHSYFSQIPFRYVVILGADFSTKTGIDVKDRTGTIEWLKNELPLFDPHDLKERDFKAMAEIIEIQQEVDFFVWIGMTQPVLQLT